MIRFRVSIGQYEHHSEDGITWTRHLRDVPARHTPVVHGDVDLRRLPARPAEAYWDFVTLHPSGFGVAADHEVMNGANNVANVFVTTDGGKHWNKRDAKPRLPRWSPPSWPVERFAALALPSPGIIVLSWEDPWLFDGAQSHVICSQDCGESWQYRRLGYTNPYLGIDYAGRLLALNDGYYMESHDAGHTWKKSHFQVDWPHRYDKKRVALIRSLIFTEAEVGFGLVVHWPIGAAAERPEVGLVTTADNGLRWRHLHVFDGPNAGDINERHVLDLRVTSSLANE
jgi:hypothetical protein